MNETRTQQNSKTSLQIKLVRPLNGKYYIDKDTEVYVYPHTGLLHYINVESKPGELPSPEEAIGKVIQGIYSNLLKMYPRLAQQTNGLILSDAKMQQKKEEAPHGQDLITTEERGRIILQPCRYIVANGRTRTALEDLFGDIF